MSIKYQILGNPGGDNAMMVWINSGTRMHRLLFDCGEDLLKELSYSDVSSIDHLFFSHLHLDHAAGFDYFLRRNYNRQNKPVIIWGPKNTAKIIANRLRGYTWNLTDKVPGRWEINDIYKNTITTSRFLTSEGFSRKHNSGKRVFKNFVFENKDFKVTITELNHIIPSIAYRVDEKPNLNIDKIQLKKSGLPSGPWLEKVKDLKIPSNKKITIGHKRYSLKELRNMLVKINKGNSIAYLTDFIFDKGSSSRAIKLVKECETVVCESQYSNSDLELAKKNYHLTAPQSAQIAKSGGINKLILFHISERYDVKEDYPGLLKEANNIFRNTFFPEEWNII